ncbi:TetR family transcriptional regulator [Streptomyces sp. 3MP-14]|uniref:TetR family transcriptional regulator n=1 Tax=Streptomyces mimosae TaxID=2586635 RepID=A0A5N5ZRM8_9ACTN|nr:MULTISPECIES: TetR/AcrR family transcriptional regulator [Streptomyces]KAB8158376.1 TetR family transcriptional regulator [Streptomyces mimosae]KAB8172569.1 TetR family transcriptional regulator [Streptomyces sp. 3MP-14]
MLDEQTSTRRRRADAERSRTAILEAAVSVLAERPDASVAAIGRAAGVTRQTVYAHFPSRRALLNAVLDRAAEESVAAMDAAEQGADSALEALRRMMDASWRAAESYPSLAEVAAEAAEAEGSEEDARRHLPLLERLVALIERGQRTGEFAPDPPAPWLASAAIALAHAAAREASAGQFTPTESLAALHVGLARLLTARDHA